MLGALGVGSIAWAIVVCFRIDAWAGLITLVVAIALTPVGWWAAMSIWPKTPIGKKLFLQPTKTEVAELPIRVGDVGVAVSVLRPMGECDFGEHRLEAICEHGMIAPGRKVKVVSISSGRAT